MINKNKIFTKRIAFLLFATIIVLSLSGFVGKSTKFLLTNPIVKKDDSLSTGQVTEWSCITFGAYPQTEIIPAPSNAVDKYAVQEGDFLEDPVLFKKLTQASWNENETEIDGTRYLRINQSDAVNIASDNSGHYRWENKNEWHYFRYDPIKWRVIGVENEKAMLMADKLLDCQPFHTDDGKITWKRSTIRSWLNALSEDENAAGIDYRVKGFMNKAFSDTERKAILLTHVKNKPNAKYKTNCGDNTEDYIFLLSNEEVFESEIAGRNGFYVKHGKDDPAKRFCSTMYAKCRGTWWSSVNKYMGNSFWFMRTNGYTQESVSYICDLGYIYERGTIPTCKDSGILPAMWIDINLAKFSLAGTVTSRDIQKNGSLYSSESRKTKELIVNPVISLDKEAPEGKSVTYCLVRFGSYPQSEILPDSSKASSHSIVDSKLYDALNQADWKNNEWVYQGVKYIRVKSSEVKENSGFRYFVCEPLLWRVLEVRNGTALLLSHMAIECEPFQKNLADVSWENCTLRSFLNGYEAKENVSGINYSKEKDNFLDMAFSLKEQNAIIKDLVRNEDNYYFGVDSGDKTFDKIFLLAESELFIYDSSEIHGFSPHDEVVDRAKQFKPTDYAIWKGVWKESIESNSGNVFWLTRTTGYTHSNVVYVDESGNMYNRGILVTCSDAAIVPALMLDLDSSVYEFAGTYKVGTN